MPLSTLPAHSVTPNAAFIPGPDGGLLLVAVSDLGAGQDVTVMRGRALTNADLLVQYGQVLDANPFDMIELDVVASLVYADDPEPVSMYCQDIPDMLHGLVGGCPDGIPPRLYRDLGRDRVLALVQYAYDVLDLDRPDATSDDDYCALGEDDESSACELIWRYRQQTAALLYRAESALSQPHPSA